jgi:hypothetical protein
MSETKKKRVNKTETELREEMEMTAMMEKEKAFWNEIREVEDKHGRRIRAFINPNIVEGIRPVISSTIVEHVVVGPEETTKQDETTDTNTETE